MSSTKDEILDRRKDHAETLQRIEASINALESLAISAEDKEYIKMAIKREARRESFQQAVIEKTIASLIWSGIVGLGYLLLDGIMSHWK